MKTCLALITAGLLLGWAGCASDPYGDAPRLASHASRAEEAWVQLFDGKDFTGPSLTIRFPREIKKLEDVRNDQGGGGFEDKASSVKWCIPEGWSFVLYEDPIFNGEFTELKGNGQIQEIRDLDQHNHRENQASSGRWVRNTD
jgi:hypothetical protein